MTKKLALDLNLEDSGLSWMGIPWMVDKDYSGPPMMFNKEALFVKKSGKSRKRKRKLIKKNSFSNCMIEELRGITKREYYNNKFYNGESFYSKNALRKHKRYQRSSGIED